MRTSFSIKSGAEQVAEELRERIRLGVWTTRMPGVLRLSREFGVGRSMMEAAFVLLRESGDLVAAGPRSAMRPVQRYSRRRDSGTLIIHDLPSEASSGEALRIVDVIGAAMPAPLTVRKIPSGTTLRELLKNISGIGARNIIIGGHGPRNVDGLVEAGFRVVAFGTAGLGTVAPLVSVNYEEMVRAAFRRCFQAGHTRVCMPLWRRKPGLANRIRLWIAEEYAAAGLRHSPEFDSPVIADEKPEAMREQMFSLMRYTPPSALVINNGMQWILINSVLASMKLIVPGNVSTILLENLPELAVYTPSQAHFRHPAESFVKPILRTFRRRGASAPGTITMLKPLWVSGDTLGPPPVKRPA